MQRPACGNGQAIRADGIAISEKNCDRHMCVTIACVEDASGLVRDERDAKMSFRREYTPRRWPIACVRSRPCPRSVIFSIKIGNADGPTFVAQGGNFSCVSCLCVVGGFGDATG